MALRIFYDCKTCGACCVNTPENRAEGFAGYIEVEAGNKLLTRKDLKKKLVTAAEDGTPCMRLTADGRCMALKGALGRAVECGVYAFRPEPCRRVEAGGRECLEHRRRHGIDA